LLRAGCLALLVIFKIPFSELKLQLNTKPSETKKTVPYRQDGLAITFTIKRTV
jgi:hypothetical protein